MLGSLDCSDFLENGTPQQNDSSQFYSVQKKTRPIAERVCLLKGGLD